MDIGLLFLRLILFEEYVIESRALTEITALLREIGFRQTCVLLRSGCVRIWLGTTGVGQIGQADVLLAQRPMGILPPGSVAFARVHQPSRFVIDVGEEQMRKAGLVGPAKASKLMRLVHRRVLDVPEDFGDAAVDQFQTDLARNDPAIRSAVVLQLRKQNIPVSDPNALEVKFHQLSDFKDVRAEISLGGRLLIDERSQHEAVEKGLLAVADLEMRLQQMRDFNLVSGFQAGELPVLDGRTQMWTQDLAPEEQEIRWRRVIEITGLPNIRNDPGIQRINIERVIRVARSKECQAFRQWLRRSDDLSPEEIRDGFSNLLDQASILYRSVPGRTLRLVITSFAPLAPPFLFGIAALDLFVIERFLPESGPAAFIAERYPSLFRQWLPPQQHPEEHRNWFR